MSEPARRPILSLKNPPAPKAPPPPPSRWKCKPCGGLVEIAASLADENDVRCPSCNARLGRAGQFRSDGPEQQKVRARLAPQTQPTDSPHRREAPSAPSVVKKSLGPRLRGIERN